jgi:hypothetical protein
MRYVLPLLLLFAIPVQAGPLHWVSHHKRFLLMEGAATGSALIGAWGLSHCRSTGVEKCTGHYGAAWGIYGTGVGINFAMTGVAEACWKNEGGKECYIPAYGGSAFQAAWGVHEYERRDNAEKPNLGSVEFVRH